MLINKRLIGICRYSKKYIALTVLMNWISIVCNILIILLIGQFINKVYKVQALLVNLEVDKLTTLLKFKVSENLSLYGTLMIIALLLIVRYFSNIMYGKFSYLASANARVTLRELIYKKLLKLGVGYNKVESTSTIVQMTVEGVEALEIYFGKYLPQFFYSMLAPITLFIFMSFISIKSALIFIACVPLIPLSIIAIMKISKKILKEYWNINIMDLIAFGGAALGIIVALFEFKNGNISVGNLFVIILLSSEFFIPLRLLGSYFHIAMNGMAACDKIFFLLDAEERKKDIKEDYISKLNNFSVTLENVNFSYDGERKIIDNINMNIPNKGMVAIVGESGSGKSTIASLIMNTNSVNDGSIKLNDVNIENISLDDIYDRISLVSTNSYIFNGSILDNLLIGKYDATKSEINNALKKARLYDFVESLTDGLNTNVGQDGSSLSGGQKQKLALARTILGNREMIIFDEATSNIDIESEEEIWDSIYELSKDKTILVISHRLSNVTNADKIYVMKNGKIIENGNHNELYTLKGEYFQMFNKQTQLERAREVC